MDLLLCDLMASSVLWDIRLEERQERVSGGGGRNGNRFRRIVLSDFRCEVGGEGRSLWWAGAENRFTAQTWSFAAAV